MIQDIWELQAIGYFLIFHINLHGNTGTGIKPYFASD